ncbi:Uncharacterised protein [Candidatus Gugararchaeum adminiculabundum]|nr:Uncharacterised protein [Candidatus Gugararchaeum adminiculabundum]
MDITYDELRKIQRLERDSSLPTQLPDDFYPSVETALKETQGKLKSDFTLELAREYENTLKILRDIYERREEKILLMALRASRTGASPQKMAENEEKLFKSVLSILNDQKMVLEHLLAARPANGNGGNGNGSGSNGGNDRKLRLKLLADIPRFVGVDAREYGPFKQGENALLPETEAEVMLRQKIAEVIQ